MMPTVKLTMLLVLILVVSLSSEAQDRTAVEGLKTKLRNEAHAVQLRHERQELIKQLIVIVADEKAEREVRIRAVKVLGDIRASEAAQVLVANIDQIMPELIDERTIMSLFPCVPALIKIGKPGAKEAQKELREPTKGARRLALAIVIGRVEGRKVGKLLLEEDIRRLENDITEVDVEALKNLRAGLKAFLAMTANEREFPADPPRTRKPKR